MSIKFNNANAPVQIAGARSYLLLEYLLMKGNLLFVKSKQADHYQQIVHKVDRRLNWELEKAVIMSHVTGQEPKEMERNEDELNATFVVLGTAASKLLRRC